MSDPRHCIQYAFVSSAYSFGDLVMSTEKLSDEQIHAKASNWDGVISRFNRCPECEAWTTHEGKLRPEIKCPAVQEALKSKLVDAEKEG